MKIKKSVFKRFFISYVLIGIVPIIIMGTLFYYYYVVSYKKNVEESNLAKLIQVKSQMDLDFKVLKDITYHISNNSEIITDKQQYLSSEDEYERLGIVTQLQAYMENTSFLNDVMLYYRGEKNLYSTDGYHYYYDFETNIKKDLEWSKSGFFKDINSLVAPKIKRIKADEGAQRINNNLLIFMYPVPYLSVLPEATIVYTMKEADFLSAVENIFGSFEGYVFVYDNSNHVLVSDRRGMNEIYKEALEDKMSSYKGTGVMKISIENKNYIAMRTVSEDSGWSYVMVIPYKQFFEEVISMRNNGLLIITALILLGFILAVFLSHKNYGPIKNLTTYIKNQDAQETYDGDNELEMIRFSFEKNYEKNRELVVQINAQRSFVRDQCLVKIIQGKVKDIHNLDYLLRCSNLELQGTVYFAMILSAKIKGKNDISIENGLKLLEEIYFAGARGYGVELVQEKMIAIIICLEKDSEDLRTDQIAIAKDVSLLVENNLGLQPAIGIGNAYTDILKLNTSFLEASSALYESFINSESNIFFFRDIKNTQDALDWHPIMEQSLYLQSLRQGNKVVAVETLNAMIDAITAKTTSYFMVKCICFDIINNVIKLINSMDIEKFSADMKKLVMFNTLNEFKEELEKFSIEFCDYIEEFKEYRSNQLKNNMIKYVNENYASDTLSLDEIASRFDISSTYVSRFFKDETGINFMDYVTNLRMDYVKKQLRNTNKSIKDIGAEVGYMDASSFSRKFRTIEGITPGQYRKVTKQVK